MDFRILGPLEVLDEDGRVALGGRRQRALLAVLLLHANETLTIDRLIDELWDEDPPAGAAKTVQMQVSRLRKALAAGNGGAGDRLLLTRGSGYQLTVDPECLDAHRFVRLVEDAEGELAASHPERALTRLEQALSMWRGAPLADLAYEHFAQRESARFEELRAGALELLIDAKLAMGRHGDVIGQLEGLIAKHPYRERLRAYLMLALYRSERQADALQAYQNARRALVEQLGIEPGQRLRELERAILAQDPGLQLPAEPESATLAGQGHQSAFVGRESELAELVAGLEGALAGRGQLFLVAGEPGIGKSRLTEELSIQARARGAQVLVGRCWEAGGAPAYWPWVQALRGYVRETAPEALQAQLGAGAGDLAQILPELRHHFPDMPQPPPPDSVGARFRMFDATTEFLRNASERRPIVLVLDDLHAADAASLLLLRFISRELGSTRMLVLGAYRDVDPLPVRALTDMLAEVAREPVTRRFSLQGLSQEEVEEYVELTAEGIASKDLLATLHDETEGNPLFVGEIVRLLSVEGVPRATGELAIPQSIRDVIARRLTHLAPECHRLLGLAAILGREFALDALARMGEVSPDELLDALDEAMAARVVSEVPLGPGRLRFTHVLIRDALYEGLTAARRMRLHRVALEALEVLYGEDPGQRLAELVHHSVAGGDFDKGFRYARRAGDRELALLAYEEAARLYEAALELQPAGRGGERTRCKLLLSLGDAEARAGNTPAAKRAFLEAAGIARRHGHRRELARAAAGYGGRFLWNRGSADATLVPLLEEGLAALPGDEVELRVRLLARLAGALRDEPTRHRCDELSSHAVELARSARSPDALVLALTGRACAVLAPDTLAEGLAVASELRDVAERIGDKERMADAHFIRLMVQLQTGDVSRVETDLATASRIADELHQPTQLWEACAARALLALTGGRLEEADKLIDRALELGGRAQPAEAIPVHGIQRYTLCDFRGGLAQVEPAIVELTREHPVRPVFRCALAHLHARLGREPEARSALAELLAGDCAVLPFDQEWLYSLSLLAETSVLVGETDSASHLYALLLPWRTLNAADYVEGARGAVSRYLGLLATAMRRWNEGARHFEYALEHNERMGALPWLAHTQSDYARMLLARDEAGDGQRALELASRALEGYQSIGMDACVGEAEQLVRAAPA